MKITKSQLKQIIREELNTVIESYQMSGAGQYRGMGAAYNRDVSEWYDKEYEDMSDEELAYVAEKDGIEDSVRFDGEGGIVNRKEVIKIIRQIESGIEEVSSEKQRRWACAQKDKPASERADSLSAKEAEEMCTSKVEEDT